MSDNGRSMNNGVQLVFDTNILVDAMIARGDYFSQAVELLEMVRDGFVEGWYAPHIVSTVYYLLERTLRKDADNRQQAAEVAHTLLAETLSFLKPLPQVGDEALTVAMKPGDDLEDVLIIQLATGYLSNPLFVTRDRWFLMMGTYNAAHPKEIIDNGLEAWRSKDSSPPFIDLKTQQRTIRPQLNRNINNVLQHGRYILGPEVTELEDKMSEFAGVRHCVGVSSGTDALLMALMAAGIGAGDAVFTTPFTFIATAEVISLLGATPVFVDIDPKTFNIDPEKLQSAIEAVKKNDDSLHPLPRTNYSSLTPKAIIPVDLFGLPADYDSIMELARKHELFVLSDSAQGFGGKYKGRRSGSLAHATTTSFFPAKPLGCYGDGGAVLTDDDELAVKLASIRVHGKGTDKYDNIRIGLNARLHTLQAAILLPKLEIFPAELGARQKVAGWYTDLLEEHAPGLIPPFVPEGLQSAWAQYSILAPSNSVREEMQSALKTAGIPSMVYYPTPLHMQTAFSGLGHAIGDFPVSVAISQKIFSLPMHPYLEKKEVERIILRLGEYVEG